MIQQIQSPCDDCSGTGEIINAKDRCNNCKGKKVLPEKKLLEVHIDKGMKGGQTIHFSGESDQAPGAQTGDVIIVIEEKPHDRFKRQETDLITEIEVDLLTALGGGQISIKHLDDRALLINLIPGEVIKHGMPFFFFFLLPCRNSCRLSRRAQGHTWSGHAISTAS
jgi:DnaJ homolog subfamily A member 2